MCLIGADHDSENLNSRNSRHSRYSNYLRSLLPSPDYGVTELAAKAIGKLGVVSGVRSEVYVKFEIQKAIEWLNERQEGKRQAAVSFFNLWTHNFRIESSSCLIWYFRLIPVCNSNTFRKLLTTIYCNKHNNGW